MDKDKPPPVGRALIFSACGNTCRRRSGRAGKPVPLVAEARKAASA